jgi:Zn-dependent peptidase ImmA (M78 family)
LREFDLRWYPIDPIEVIRKKAPKWKVASIEEVSDWLDKSAADTIAALLRGSKDGVAYYSVENDQYSIILNSDEEIPFTRFRWSAMHEIGHIYLGHFTDNKVAYITDSNPAIPPDEYDQLEREANIFTGEVLASKWLMRSLDIVDEEQITEICGISDPAALIQYQKATASYEYEPPNVTVTLRTFAAFKEEITVCKPTTELRLPAFASNNRATQKLSKPIAPFLRKKGVCPFCGSELGDSSTANFCIYCDSALKLGVTKKTAPCGHIIKNGRAVFCEECGQPVFKIRRGFIAETEDEIY